MASREVNVKLKVDTSEYDAAMKRAREEIALNGRPTWAADLAVALGYAPESWDGMWKLTADPFTFGPDHVLVEEVVYRDATRVPVWEDDKVITRHIRHEIPEGWTTEPVYRVVPPSE